MPSAHRLHSRRAETLPSEWRERLPLLNALSRGPRERLASVMARLELETGSTFLHEGETTPFLAVVVTGRVASRMRVPERGSITILTLDAGDFVGWTAIVAPYRATASATTLEPTELAVVDAETLRDLLSADEAFAAAFLPLVLDTVSARLAATRDQLLDLFDGSGVEPW